MKENMNKVIIFIILVCGLVISAAMYFEKTNIILAFGFMLNAVLIAWSKK